MNESERKKVTKNNKFYEDYTKLINNYQKLLEDINQQTHYEFTYKSMEISRKYLENLENLKSNYVSHIN